MISIPPKKLVMINKLYKQSALFYRRHGRNPDDEESALIVRIDAEKIKFPYCIIIPCEMSEIEEESLKLAI